MHKLTLTADDLAFFATRTNDRKTMAVGYISHLDPDVAKTYAAIYRQHIDKDFVLTAWCDDCRFRMVKRIYEQLGDAIDKANEPKEVKP